MGGGNLLTTMVRGVWICVLFAIDECTMLITTNLINTAQTAVQRWMVMGMLEKLYRLIRDFLFNAPVVSDMNLAEYLITNGVTIPVHCKDCKDHDRCEVEDLLRYFDPTSEPYCSVGERKDNG